MKIIITEKQQKMLEESYTDGDNPTKYTYVGVGVYKMGKTQRYYFNNVVPVNDPNPIDNMIKIEGSSGDFVFDENQLFFNKKNNSIGVNIYDFEKKYPNGLKKSQSTKIGINSKTVKEALMKAFPEYWRNETDEFSAGLRGIYPIGSKLGTNEDWSIMNYFDTKQEIHDLLYLKYFDKENEGYNGNIVDWMADLFNNNIPFLEMLVNRQWKSIESGLKLERDTVDNFINKTKPKSIKYHPHGSKMDRFAGVDVTVDGVSYQIKPLKGFTENDTEYFVSTYGMRDYQSKKMVDKIAFANNKQVIIFNNKNYIVVSKDSVIFLEPPTILN